MKTTNLASILMTSVLVLSLVILSKTIFAQEAGNTSVSKKQITVTGSAEMSIDPDQVEISIVLYSSRNDFKKHEEDFIEICKKHKIPEDQLSFKNTSADWSYWNYWYYWWYYRNANDIAQTYKLKVNSKVNLLEFVQDLNKTWVRNISVTSTSNKDMQMYRKEVKKEAIRMAKEKATYLLEAIDAKIGSVISVEEVTADNNSNNKQTPHGYNPYYGWYWNNPYYGNQNNSASNSNMNSNSVMSSNNVAGGNNSADDGIEGLSKIKLRYEVKTVFEIQ